MKFVLSLLANAVLSAAIAHGIVKHVEPTLPPIIRCERLEATESINARQLVTGYVRVQVPGRSSDLLQPVVTIGAGQDFAGVQVTDGSSVKMLWVDKAVDEFE